MSLFIAGELEEMTFKGPFRLRWLYDSIQTLQKHPKTTDLTAGAVWPVSI